MPAAAVSNISPRAGDGHSADEKAGGGFHLFVRLDWLGGSHAPDIKMTCLLLI